MHLRAHTQTERERLLAEHRAVVADLGALRDALMTESASAKEADAGARTLQTRLAGVQRQLALKVHSVACTTV